MVAIYQETTESMHDPLEHKEDKPTWGSDAPLMQHEREDANYPVQELLTFDTQINRLLGQNRIVNGSRVMVEAGYAPELIVDGVLKAVGDELKINLSGNTTVTCQLTGTWSAGAISFSVSNDGQYWGPISGIGTAATVQVTSTAGQGIFRFNVAGLLMFRVTSAALTGIARVRMVASTTAVSNTFQQMVGNQTTINQRGNTPYELLTYDPYVQPVASRQLDALSELLPWNPKGSYTYGDTVLFNGIIYICILPTLVTYTAPPSATYWAQDFRGANKSLITTQYTSAPPAARMRVEIDLDGYQNRMREQQLLAAQLAYWDNKRQLEQGGLGQGESGMSCYVMDELR
jgi:hypothetical protein